MGPVIGGVISEKASWRVSLPPMLLFLALLNFMQWCFWVTLPVAGFAVAVVLLVLPLKPVEGNIRRYE